MINKKSRGLAVIISAMMIFCYIPSIAFATDKISADSTNKIIYTSSNIKKVGNVNFSSATKKVTYVELNWKKPTNADGYIIYRATSKTGKYKKLVKITNENITKYRDSNLKTKKSYYYKIAAYAATKVNGKYQYDKDYSPVHKYTTKFSMSYSNAEKKAEEYLDFMAFSRSGLVDQLAYEGFTSSQAEYGVKHCGANWNTQAKLDAKAYIDVMVFSRSGLVEQLEFDGFTPSQAEYGVKHCGVNWD